jgi:hypothetical protein
VKADGLGRIVLEQKAYRELPDLGMSGCVRARQAAFGSSIRNGNEPRDLGSVVLTGPDC